MKRRKIIWGLLMVLALFASCSKADDSEMPQLLQGSVKVWLYEDVVYMIDGTSIKAISLSDVHWNRFLCVPILFVHMIIKAVLYF